MTYINNSIPESARPIILASGSPRRIKMLSDLGLSFAAWSQEIDESADYGEKPEIYVFRISAEKVDAALESYSSSGSGAIALQNAPRFNKFDESEKRDDPVFLGADTVVVCDGKLMGKPETRSEAGEMISSLSGRTHQVISGYSIADLKGDKLHGTVTTSVKFRRLEDVEIEDYLNTMEWTDKAGAYGIQGAAAFMVEAIDGSYTNVVGLPLAEVTRALRRMGAVSNLFCSRPR
jgi:septum formation protein